MPASVLLTPQVRPVKGSMQHGSWFPVAHARRRGGGIAKKGEPHSDPLSMQKTPFWIASRGPLERLVDLHSNNTALINEPLGRSAANGQRPLELLEGNPIVDVAFVAGKLDIARTTASNLVKDFADMGILDQREKEKQRYRTFLKEPPPESSLPNTLKRRCPSASQLVPNRRSCLTLRRPSLQLVN